MYALAVLVSSIAALIASYALTLYFSNAPRAIDPKEMEYITAKSSGTLPYITQSDSSVLISVVVPAYNEEQRLPSLFESAVPFLLENYKHDWEILVVNDGSKDQTVDVALKWAATHNVSEQIKVCSFVSNRGKGGAVTHGMKTASGEYILFADADNASDFTALPKLIKALNGNKRAISIGSRAHLVNTQEVIKRSFVRNLLMRCFHLLVSVFGVRTIKDTQCGFKLFTREAARDIFPYMHTEGWIFDVEALIIAQQKDIPVQEISISWHEVGGSKIDLARDSIQMAVDLVVMRFAYMFGIYSSRVEKT